MTTPVPSPAILKEISDIISKIPDAWLTNLDTYMKNTAVSLPWPFAALEPYRPLIAQGLDVFITVEQGAKNLLALLPK